MAAISSMSAAASTAASAAGSRRLPINVALISFGERDPEPKRPKQIHDEICFQGCFAFHVNEKLPKDPENGGVSPWEHGAYPNTQLQVMRQEQFPEVVRTICSTIADHAIYSDADQPIGSKVSCTKGNHRSYVVCGTVAEVMNEQLTTTGERIFNCCHFKMAESFGRQGTTNTINNFLTWASADGSERPIVRGGVPMSVENRYGYDAVCSDTVGWKNMKDVHEFASDEFPQVLDMKLKSAGIIQRQRPLLQLQPDVRADAAAAAPGTTQADGQTDATATASTADGPGPRLMTPTAKGGWQPSPPPLPSHPPPAHLYAAAHAASSAWGVQHGQQAPPPPPPPPAPWTNVPPVMHPPVGQPPMHAHWAPPVQPAPPTQAPTVQHAAHTQAPPMQPAQPGYAPPMQPSQPDHAPRVPAPWVVQQSQPPYAPPVQAAPPPQQSQAFPEWDTYAASLRDQGRHDEPPAWVTLDFNVRNWWYVLKNMGVDDAAIQSLMLLASAHSVVGQQAANKIIRQVMFKTWEQTITNPSAFVFASALSERKRIAPWEFPPDDGHGQSKRRRVGK